MNRSSEKLLFISKLNKCIQYQILLSTQNAVKSSQKAHLHQFPISYFQGSSSTISGKYPPPGVQFISLGI